MAKVQFRLATLLRLRETLRDERRQELVAAQQAEQATRDVIAQMDHEATEMRRSWAIASHAGSIDIDALRDAAHFQLALSAQRQMALKTLADCSAQVDRARQSLLAADQALKTLEKLLKRQQDRNRQLEQKQELSQLDAQRVPFAPFS